MWIRTGTDVISWPGFAHANVNSNHKLWLVKAGFPSEHNLDTGNFRQSLVTK